MKRLLCFLCSVLCLIGFCGCKKSVDDFDEPAKFYYIKDPVTYYAEDSVLSAEIREITNYNGNTLDIINYYLCGTASDGFRSPFPTGSAIQSFERNNNTVAITVNDSFASLSGIDLSIACAAVTMTLVELTGCDTVEIIAGDSLLDGASRITLTRDTMFIHDNPQKAP